MSFSRILEKKYKACQEWAKPKLSHPKWDTDINWFQRFSRAESF